MARTYGTQIESSDVAKNPGFAVTVATAASTPLVAGNPGRVLAILTNNGANDVFLSLGGTAAVDVGPVLKANGGSLTIRNYTGAINARAKTADVSVTGAEV